MYTTSRDSLQKKAKKERKKERNKNNKNKQRFQSLWTITGKIVVVMLTLFYVSVCFCDLVYFFKHVYNIHAIRYKKKQRKKETKKQKQQEQTTE